MRRTHFLTWILVFTAAVSLFATRGSAQRDPFMQTLTNMMVQGQIEAERSGAEPVREIKNVTGDLYRFRSGGHYGIFLVTSEGIILVDPLNTAASTWLKGELDERFDVPVRYVIYSHFHYDHIEGGGVFSDTAEIVAHENTVDAMYRGVAQTLPGATYDDNGDAIIQREEAVTGMRAAFDRLDRNGDDLLTGAEMFAEIPPPDITYSDRHTLTLGGKNVELVYPGPNHAPDMTVVLFPEERTMFTVDIISIGGLPLEPYFDRRPLTSWIESIRTIESLDFDIAALGHGNTMGTKADVSDQRAYFENLVRVVSEAMDAGMSLDEFKATSPLEEYSDWGNYEMLRGPHVDWAWENLTAYPLSD